jgi:hypothetical protein
LICVQISLVLRLGASTTAISRLPSNQSGRRICALFGRCCQRKFCISRAVARFRAQADGTSSIVRYRIPAIDPAEVGPSVPFSSEPHGRRYIAVTAAVAPYGYNKMSPYVERCARTDRLDTHDTNYGIRACPALHRRPSDGRIGEEQKVKRLFFLLGLLLTQPCMGHDARNLVLYSRQPILEQETLWQTVGTGAL